MKDGEESIPFWGVCWGGGVGGFLGGGVGVLFGFFWGSSSASPGTGSRRIFFLFHNAVDGFSLPLPPPENTGFILCRVLMVPQKLLLFDWFFCGALFPRY